MRAKFLGLSWLLIFGILWDSSPVLSASQSELSSGKYYYMLQTKTVWRKGKDVGMACGQTKNIAWNILEKFYSAFVGRSSYAYTVTAEYSIFARNSSAAKTKVAIFSFVKGSDGSCTLVDSAPALSSFFVPQGMYLEESSGAANKKN